MSEEPASKVVPPPIPAFPQPPVIPVFTDPPEPTPLTVSPATLFAALLIEAFWLPWLKAVGIPVSGMALALEPGIWRLLWLIPAAGGCAILAGLPGLRQREVAQAAGFVPWLALIYPLTQAGPQLFEAFEIGIWVSLATGGLLILSPYMVAVVPGRR